MVKIYLKRIFSLKIFNNYEVTYILGFVVISNGLLDQLHAVSCCWNVIDTNENK